jgi:SAM-dependent methyltransferase
VVSAVRWLPRVAPSPPDRPAVGGPDHPMRVLTRAIASDPDAWDPARVAQVLATFDGLAASWDDRFEVDEVRVPVADALDRGGPWGRRWVEVGAGTGRGTAAAHAAGHRVVATDLSFEMVRRIDPVAGARVRADSARLPVRTGAVDVLLAVNTFLFPREVERVLAPAGALVWVNTLAEDTPIHLPAEDVAAALAGSWDGVAAPAGWGAWAVFRRVGR